MAAIVAAAVAGGLVLATNGDRSDVDPVQEPAAAGPTFPTAIGPLTIGDQRTADPCSLLDPSALSGFGRTIVYPDLSEFAECVVDLPQEGDAVVNTTVRFGPPSDDPPDGEQRRLGDALVVRRPADATGCRRFVVLSDGTPVAVASRYYGSGPSPLDQCAVAETATAAVATTLAERGIGRREPPDAPGSLWSVDACSLLEPADLAVLPAVARVEPVMGFGNWQCSWSDGTDPQTSVYVAFRRDRQPGPDDGTQVAVGAATGYVERSEGQCEVVVGRRRFPASNGGERVEILRVGTEGPQPEDQLCAAAKELTTAAVARLPQP